jgi:hypothetical protein
MPKKRIPKKLPMDLAPLIGPNKINSGEPMRKKLAYMNKKTQRIKLDDRWVEILQKIFLNTKNGLAAWDAYQVARESGQNIPDWVIGYFDRVAGALCRKGNKNENLPEYLEMQNSQGGRSAFTRYENYWEHRRAVVNLCQELYENPDETIDEACRKVVKKDRDLDIDYLRLKDLYNRMSLDW